MSKFSGIIFIRSSKKNSYIIFQHNFTVQNQIQILTIIIITFIRSCLRVFSAMNRQTLHSHQSKTNQSLNRLHNIFSQKQIVQSYSPHNNRSLILAEERQAHAKNLKCSDMFLQHPDMEAYQKKHKKFMEDDFIEELHSANIVENYSMLDERDQIYQPYQNVFKGRGEKPVYLNQNMLASSSQNNDVPSRNSSLSSLSQKNHIVNVNLNSSFDKNDLFQKQVSKGYAKNSLLLNKPSHKKIYQVNSQSEMDIENSPLQNYHHHIHNGQKHKLRNNMYYLQPKANAKLQIDRNNAFINPQKVQSFPNYRRMDIDDQQQKRQRLQKIQKIQQIGCNCKKTKCLKMYCQCFNLQIFCNQNCNCCGCCNQQSNDEHKKAVLDALTRNPKAFNQVTQKIDAAFTLGVELNEVKKGCKCKKTRCQKKYCECYSSGQICGKFCKCQGCQNC